MTEIRVGNFVIEDNTAEREPISLLLWGPSGSGKTTLAATAPGKKLWLRFDPGGTSSIVNRDDIQVVKLDIHKPRDIAEEFKTDQKCLSLDKMLTENPSLFDTLVVDSVTSFKEQVFPYAVQVAQSTVKGRGATLEDPGFAGHGNINTWVRLLVTNLLRICVKHGKHVIFVAHEDKPTVNDDGAVMFISIMLGSSLNQQVPLKINETWWLFDNGKARTIAVRPCRQRQPMKSRIFRTDKGPEFVWNFNADTLTGEGIAEWYDRWVKAGTKIPLP